MEASGILLKLLLVGFVVGILIAAAAAFVRWVWRSLTDSNL